MSYILDINLMAIMRSSIVVVIRGGKVMSFTQFIIEYHKYIISACCCAVFLLVNIIQAIRTHNKNKLKEALCRLPDIIRQVEEMYADVDCSSFLNSTTTIATCKGVVKKATAESLLYQEFGTKFVKKYIGLFDDVIEDILNTPAKKGGTYGVQKKNEEE